MKRAVKWADGLAGFHMGPDLDEIEAVFNRFRATWREAGREKQPKLQLAFWFGLVDDAPSRVAAFARDYLKIFGDEFAELARVFRSRARFVHRISSFVRHRSSTAFTNTPSA